MIVRLVKYSLGGLAGFFLDIFFVNVFVHYGVNYNIAIILGFAIAAWIFSYLFHRHVTFEAQGDGDHKDHFSKFSVVTTVVFIIDVGMALLFANGLLAAYENKSPLLLVLVNWIQDVLSAFPISATVAVILVNIAKVLGAIIGGIGHYVLLHFWVFKKKEKHHTVSKNLTVQQTQEKKAMSA